MVDGGEPGVDSRDEGKHTGRNDLLFVKKMMWIFFLRQGGTCYGKPITNLLTAAGIRCENG